uniref:Uncharacterized protein n=1 Tax=Rhizophora mucronata TaxID=61149 RepID=A0A2P2N927_RHIMU
MSLEFCIVLLLYLCACQHSTCINTDPCSDYNLHILLRWTILSY